MVSFQRVPVGSHTKVAADYCLVATDFLVSYGLVVGNCRLLRSVCLLRPTAGGAMIMDL